MKTSPEPGIEPLTQAFLRDVLEGLQKPQKEIPCKYLYDKKGSEIFDQIVECEDYYPPRVEARIMRENMRGIGECLGPQCFLIEPGAGSAVKVRVLLDQGADIAAFAPVDISAEHGQQAAEKLAREYPDLEIIPVTGDFTIKIEVPTPEGEVRRRVVFFPGSTIGNFGPKEAVSLLQSFAKTAGPGGGLLIGVDLKKDQATLERAYDDREGLSAAFNLNLLERMNRELGSNFQRNHFYHHAPYLEDRGRVEMHLVSTKEQTVQIGDLVIRFREGESIHTESAHKYSISGFEAQASLAGFVPEKVWIDDDRLFSVHYLSVA